MTRTKQQVWGNHLKASPDDLMVAFTAGRDVTTLPMADEVLLPFDLWTNRAHAIMLHQQGIVAAPVLERMLAALNDLEADWEAGRFALDPALEDVHVNVERYVSEKEGAEVGGRLHTGRSRNDQVGCDMRLYLREALLELVEGVQTLAETLLESAAEHVETVLPGFTHHQPAMYTSWGHWLCSYAQALCRDLERARLAFDLTNRNPLGAAAAFGTSWPIDRALTTELLAYDRLELNTLDCIAARWEHETQVAFTYADLMNHLSVMSQDLILLAHPYWNMLTLPDAFVTGSSIMPQKRNPDLAEVIKGKTAWVVGMTAGLLAMPKGGMSGFNRDTQTTKYAVMDVVRECRHAAPVLQALFAQLTVHPDRMRERLNEGYLAAADFADALSRTLDIPFRAAYEVAALAVKHSGDAGVLTEAAARTALTERNHDPEAAAQVLSDLADPARVLGWRTHQGAPSPAAVSEQIDILREEVSRQAAFAKPKAEAIEAARRRCREYRPG